MDYEKEYKNLVAKVKNAHSFAQTDSTKSVLEDILPELRESEVERTRKRLIEFISDIKRISESGRTSWAVRKDDVEMCNAFLSYLGKQKKPEVDIEKEIDELWKSLNTGHEYVIVDSYQDFLGICLHCFELGLNARKEENK